MPDVDAPLVLVNPAASRLADVQRRDELVADLDMAVRLRAGVSPLIVMAADLAEARAWLAGAEAAGRRLVVVAGGDGSVREAANELAGTGIALGIIPLGTANLFAASVGIPLESTKAIAAVAHGRVRSIDLGRARWQDADGGIEERVFVVACGTGFDARLMEATTSGAKRRLGRYGYFVTGARMLGAIRGFDAVVEVDDHRHVLEAIAIIVANTGQLIPGLVRPARPIRVTDGLLDVIVIAAGGPVGATVGAIEAVARRSIGRSRTGRSLRMLGASVRVETTPAQPLEIDGDPVGAGSLEATSLPAALQVIVAAASERRASTTPTVQDMAK